MSRNDNRLQDQEWSEHRALTRPSFSQHTETKEFWREELSNCQNLRNTKNQSYSAAHKTRTI